VRAESKLAREGDDVLKKIGGKMLDDLDMCSLEHMAAIKHQHANHTQPPMKKYLRTSIILPLLIAALATPAFGVDAKKKGSAADKPAAAKPTEASTTPAKEAPPASKPKLLPYQGEVDAVDTATKTFVLKNKDGKAHTFSVTDQTQLMHGDASPAQFDEIKVGEWVRGSRIKTGDAKWDAVKVTIGKKEVAEKPKATAPAAKPAEQKAE
jgi:hypothetical protein